mgnify:CR=1 FL=1
MRRFYNKGAKGLSGGQVKLDKMGNNDGKISGEDFAVIRSQKMGGGMMQRPMYKDGSPKTKQEKNFKITKNNIGKIKETIKKGRSEAFKSNVKPFKDGGMMKEAKEINSKIKNSRTLKMGGGRVKKAGGGGLYANIKAKKDRIAAGSGEKMRKVGTKGAPTAQNFINAAKTAKKV